MTSYNLYLKMLDDKDIDDKLRYFLVKAILEFHIKEYKLSFKSYKEALKYIDFSEDTMDKILRLSIIYSYWNGLLCILKDNEEKLFKMDYQSSYMKSFVLIYKSLYYEEKMDVGKVLGSCENEEERSIFLYLLSKLNCIGDDIKDSLYEEALNLYKDNLAVGEELLKKGLNININLIKRLIDIEKVENLNIEFKEKLEESLDFEFLPLGGGDNVGGSSYYIRIKDFSIIVDAGMDFNSKDNYPNYRILEELNLIDKVQFLIITHAHIDHCGSLFELYDKNKKMKIIMTKETKELIKLNLKNRALELGRYHDLENLMSKAIVLNFNESLNIKKNGASIELYRAGHILGASSIMIRSDKCNVFVTGDYSLNSQKTVQGIQLPIDERIDVLITENTYGNKEEEEAYEHECEKFKECIETAIKRNKKILIPSFSIGRSQEIITLINEVKEKVRVYIDGSSIEATKLYEKLLGTKILKHSNYYVNDEFYKSKKDFINEEILTNTCCVISSSGMLLENTASSEYAKYMLSDDSCMCILIGYQANNTVGLKLKEQMNISGEKFILIEGKQYEIKAELKSFNLSAHVNTNEIIATELYLKAKNVILVHGEYKGVETIVEKKLKELSKANIYQSINNKIIKI